MHFCHTTETTLRRLYRDCTSKAFQKSLPSFSAEFSARKLKLYLLLNDILSKMQQHCNTIPALSKCTNILSLPACVQVTRSCMIIMWLQLDGGEKDLNYLQAIKMYSIVAHMYIQNIDKEFELLCGLEANYCKGWWVGPVRILQRQVFCILRFIKIDRALWIWWKKAREYCPRRASNVSHCSSSSISQTCLVFQTPTGLADHSPLYLLYWSILNSKLELHIPLWDMQAFCKQLPWFLYICVRDRLICSNIFDSPLSCLCDGIKELQSWEYSLLTWLGGTLNLRRKAAEIILILYVYPHSWTTFLMFS